MKLSDLRVCDNCHQVLAPQGQFYVLRVSMAFVSPNALRQVVGLSEMFGGALGLAEVMAPDADVIKVVGDEDKSLMSEFLICQKCVLYGPVDVALMLEAKRPTDA